MSRIGRLPVVIPAGVDVTISGREVSVRGPKGQLSLEIAEPIDEGRVRALHGLSRTLVANMVTGVTEGYRKTLEIVGVGYRVQAKGSGVEFSLGYSHPVPVRPAHLRPAGGRRRGPDGRVSVYSGSGRAGGAGRRRPGRIRRASCWPAA